MSEVIPLGPAARMLTTREAALRLGVSLRTVQLWVEADILPAARTPGGHRRIPHNAVEALALSTGLGGALPAGSLPVGVRAKGPAAAALSNGLAGGGSPVRDVLLVADNPLWQVRCEQALASLAPAIGVRVADTGYMALLEIGQKVPDLLITNLELPGMDGLAMLRCLERSESSAGMSVLAFSHLDERTLQHRGGLPLHAELMPWPASAERVAEWVGCWLRQPKRAH